MLLYATILPTNIYSLYDMPVPSLIEFCVPQCHEQSTSFSSSMHKHRAAGLSLAREKLSLHHGGKHQILSAEFTSQPHLSPGSTISRAHQTTGIRSSGGENARVVAFKGSGVTENFRQEPGIMWLSVKPALATPAFHMGVLVREPATLYC